MLHVQVSIIKPPTPDYIVINAIPNAPKSNDMLCYAPEPGKMAKKCYAMLCVLALADGLTKETFAHERKTDAIKKMMMINSTANAMPPNRSYFS